MFFPWQSAALKHKMPLLVATLWTVSEGRTVSSYLLWFVRIKENSILSSLSTRWQVSHLVKCRLGVGSKDHTAAFYFVSGAKDKEWSHGKAKTAGNVEHKSCSNTAGVQLAKNLYLWEHIFFIRLWLRVKQILTANKEGCSSHRIKADTHV